MLLSILFCTHVSAQIKVTSLSDTIIHFEQFSSKWVMPRNIDVWLPPTYSKDQSSRYPVLYMHDGQNIFSSQKSGSPVKWDVDLAVKSLLDQHKIVELIVVGIWNTPLRFREYAPQDPLASLAEDSLKAVITKIYGGESIANDYLKFIVEELKPFIDSHFRTITQSEHTFIMGSSMGGLISIYAICKYPNIFGGAGCVSTHWPFIFPKQFNPDISKMMTDYLQQYLSEPLRHKIYFDHGTETLDALYEPYQQEVDKVMRSHRYVQGTNWLTKVFPGADHSEKAWKNRVEIPLTFFLSNN